MARRVTFTLLSVSLLLVAVPSIASGAIEIVRIQYDPPGEDTGSNSSLNKEYVVLTNTGTRAVNLTEWILMNGAHHHYRFGSFKLKAGQSVTIHTGSGNNRAKHLYQESPDYLWDNDGDTAKLHMDNGAQVDSCSYPAGGTGSVSC